MRNILITGGAGYIGSVLSQLLLNYNYNVTILDDFRYKQNINHLCYLTSCNIIKGDIRNENLIKSLMSKSDVIIPLAALVGAPVCNLNPYDADTINKDAIFSMLKLKAKEQIILMPTTNSAYGSGDVNNFCTEESPLNPISKYAIDKVSIEKELMQHENVISFRLATVMGMSPRMRLDLLVNQFVYRAIHDKNIVIFEGHFKRNYIHVRDVAMAFVTSLSAFNKMKNQIFNVGLSNANISKLELAYLIKKYVPDFIVMEAEYVKDQDQRNYIVSNSKLENTGWRPVFNLDFTIQELLKGIPTLKNTVYDNLI
jgi:nucleoside-diphosphate-sugar epimerase